MDVRSARQPWQQRSVFDRVPRPDATPAEHFIAPPATKQNADGEERPRKQCPSAGFEQPTFAETTSDQCGNRESERHGEPDESQVQDRRVEQHQNMVLQERIRARSRCRIESCDTIREWVGWAETDHCEERRDDEHHNQRPANEHIIGSFPEPPGHRSGEASEHKRPEQNRPFKGGPHRCKVVERRGVSRANLLNVGHREVASDQRPLHHHHRERDAHHGEPRITRALAKQLCVALADAVQHGQRTENGCTKHQHQSGTANSRVQRRREHHVESPVEVTPDTTPAVRQKEGRIRDPVRQRRDRH